MSHLDHILTLDHFGSAPALLQEGPECPLAYVRLLFCKPLDECLDAVEVRNRRRRVVLKDHVHPGRVSPKEAEAPRHRGQECVEELVEHLASDPSIAQGGGPVIPARTHTPGP